MLVRFRQELKRCHGARALIYSLQESKTGFTGTTASGAKRPLMDSLTISTDDAANSGTS
jgi:hypothetical protein